MLHAAARFARRRRQWVRLRARRSRLPRRRSARTSPRRRLLANSCLCRTPWPSIRPRRRCVERRQTRRPRQHGTWGFRLAQISAALYARSQRSAISASTGQHWCKSRQLEWARRQPSMLGVGKWMTRCREPTGPRCAFPAARAVEHATTQALRAAQRATRCMTWVLKAVRHPSSHLPCFRRYPFWSF